MTKIDLSKFNEEEKVIIEKYKEVFDALEEYDRTGKLPKINLNLKKIDITRLGPEGQITIPAEMRKGMKEGEKLIAVKKGEWIILKKPVSDLALLSEGSLAETWTNKEEDEAWKDL